MSIAILTHGDCLAHDQGAHYPECPARLTAIEDQLTASRLDSGCCAWKRCPPLATGTSGCRHRLASPPRSERHRPSPRVFPRAPRRVHAPRNSAFSTTGQLLLPAFAPQRLFVCVEFSAQREDDMALLGWTGADYAWVSARIREVAQRHGRGRIVSVLEGGHALPALGRSGAARVRELGDF